MVENENAALVVDDTFDFAADPDRLQQLFENLFRNAVEHAGDDVTIRVGALDGDGFYIEDDGPGIPEDKREKVFDSGFTTNRDGTGFGLAIVMEIVEAHGWQISVTEGDTGGARFEVTNVELRS
jgi:signal transduction histidine kinase